MSPGHVTPFGKAPNNTGYTFTGDDIQIGYAVSTPATFVPVYVVNGVVSWDDASATAFDLSGSLATFATANNAPVPVWSSPTAVSLAVANVLGNGASLTGAGTVAVTGVPLQIESFGLGQVSDTTGNLTDVAALRGDLNFDFNVDGHVDLTVAVGGANFVYVADNQVEMTGADVAVSSNFDIFGLELTIPSSDPLTLVYDGAQNEFEMSGEVTFSVLNPDNSSSFLTAEMESQSGGPGLIIQDGTVEQLDFDINGGFSIFYLKFEAEDVGLDYNNDGNYFALFGTATVQLTKGISGSASLGTESSPGLTVTDGQWDMVSFTASIETIPLGAFSLDDLSINFMQQSDGSYRYGGQGVVLLPGSVGLGGEMEFTAGELTNFAVTIQLGEASIPLGPSGLFLTGIGGGLGNLDDPANLIFAGRIGVSYGPQFDLTIQGDTQKVSIAQAVGTFWWDSQQLVLDAKVYLGSYSVGNDYFGLVGQGDGNIDLDWGAGKYTADVSVELLNNTFTIDAAFALNTNGSVFIGGQAEMNVPSKVPFIGGDNLFGASFEMNWQSTGGANNGPQGVVAGWTELFGNDIGIAYNLMSFMSDQDVDSWELIGNQQVQTLEDGGNIFSSNQYTYSVPYTLPPTGAPAPITATFSATWPDVGGTQTFSVVLPDGTTICPGLISTGTSVGSSQAQPVPNTPPGQKSYMMELYVQEGSLPTGTYTVQVQSSNALSLDISTTSDQWTAVYSYVQPEIVINSNQQLPDARPTLTVPVSAQVQSGLESQSVISLFIDDDPTELDGSLLTLNGQGTSIPFGNGFADVTIDLSGLLAKTYYLYATINDGFNPTVTSQAVSVTVIPPLAGIVTDSNNNPLAGVAVWIDNPAAPNGVYDPPLFNTDTGEFVSGDYSTVTDSQGAYTFSGPLPFPVVVGGVTYPDTFVDGESYSVGVVVTDGFELPAGVMNPQSFVFDAATNAKALFTLNQFTFVEGLVYNDQNNNGMRDGNERAVPGVLVTIDDGLEKHSTTTNASGVYTFHSLSANTTYTVALASANLQTGVPGLAIWTPNSSNTFTTDGNPNGVFNGEAFDFPVAVPIPIQGTVTGYPVDDPETIIGLGGWTVTATGADANHVAVTKTTTTDSAGGYAFTDLLPGAYTVTETVQGGWYELDPGLATLTWGNGVGLFTNRSFPGTVDAGDLDGDGHTDLIVSMNAIGEVDIAFGSSTGFSSFQVAIAGVGGLIQSALADVNGDGLLDVILVSVANSTLTVNAFFGTGYRNDPFSAGPGASYSLALESNQSVKPQLVVADYDNDGKDDFALAIQHGTQSGTVVVVRSTGSSFSQVYTHPTFGGGVAVGDVDKDGYVDTLFWAENPQGLFGSSANVSIAFTGKNSSGGLTFDYQWITQDWATSVLPNNIALGDFDNNGALDVVFDASFGSSDDYFLYYYLNPGSRSGLLAVNSNTPISTSLAYATVPQIAVADFNVDGRADIGINTLRPVTQVFTNTGKSPYFSPYISLTNGDIMAGTPLFTLAADANDDGVPDLLFVTSDYQGVAVFYSEFVATTPGYQVQTTDPLNALITSPSTSNLTPNFTNHQFTNVTGQVYEDINRNGRRDPDEPGVAGFTVFVDHNHNGRLDKNEARTVTNADGLYAIHGGKHDGKRVRVLPLPGWELGATTKVDRGVVLTKSHAVTRSLLSPLSDFTVREGDRLSFLAGQTSQVQLLGLHLKYRLLKGPAGATLDPSTGLFAWQVPVKHGRRTVTGQIVRGRQTVAVTIEVLDPFNPRMHEIKTVRVTVLPVQAYARG